MRTETIEDARYSALIDGLLSGLNIKQSAQAVGLPVTTVRRWTQKPKFKEMLRAARGELSNSVFTTIIGNCNRATQTLLKIMSDSKAPPLARVQAARTILEFSFRGIESVELLNRIEALEHRANEMEEEPCT